jgi:hypothetical protein
MSFANSTPTASGDGRVRTLRALALAAVATAVFFSPADAKKKDDPPPPPGCHWQAIAIVHANLAIPDGWLYKDTSSGMVLTYEVRPGGAGFEKSKSVYRLEVHRGLKKSDVVPRAREFVETARSTAMSPPPIDEQEAGHLAVFACAVNYAPETPGGSYLSSALSAAANTETGTLYTTRLDIPSDEIDRVSPLGNRLFQNIRLDDTF